MRLDYATQPMALHDRFLLCSDGVHAYLTPEAMSDILRERSASDDTARELVRAALDAGSTDNCTALVIDVVELPTAESTTEVGSHIMQLPLIPVPVVGEAVDGFVLKVLVSDGRYSRLFGAVDEVEGGEVVLKFPKPQVAAVATYHAAFVREAWVGARVNSPWVGRIIELPPGRQTCLYTVMPLYQGELLSAASRGVHRSVSKKGAISRSSLPAESRRCIAPASSIATSSRITSFSRVADRSS